MRRGLSTSGQPVLRFRNGLAMRTRDLAIAAALVALFCGLALASLNVGQIALGPAQIWATLRGDTVAQDQLYAIGSVRAPRIVLGFMAGASTALAGAILQPLARNPLADPGLFGISAGSMTAIMLLLAFAPTLPQPVMVLAAVAGGLAVAGLLIWLVGNAQASGLAILLMGIAVGTVLSAVDAFLLLYLPAEQSYSIAGWLAGSLFQADWSTIRAFAPLFAASILGIVLIGPSLNRYDLGHELAMALGDPVARSRPLILCLAVLLSAASVTAVGPLSFLGILAPHLATFLSGASGRARLFLSALVGGNLVVAADILTRASFASVVSIPVGLGFVLIGVPLFILTMRLHMARQST